jgi:hypothetical protein
MVETDPESLLLGRLAKLMIGLDGQCLITRTRDTLTV